MAAVVVEPDTRRCRRADPYIGMDACNYVSDAPQTGALLIFDEVQTGFGTHR